MQESKPTDVSLKSAPNHTDNCKKERKRSHQGISEPVTQQAETIQKSDNGLKNHLQMPSEHHQIEAKRTKDGNDSDSEDDKEGTSTTARKRPKNSSRESVSIFRRRSTRLSFGTRFLADRLAPVLMEIRALCTIECVTQQIKEVEKRLHETMYHTFGDFMTHIWNIFDEAKLKVTTEAENLNIKLMYEKFIEVVDPVRAEVGYCCSHNLTYPDRLLLCGFHTKTEYACEIEIGDDYYLFDRTSQVRGMTVTEKVKYCVDHFMTFKKRASGVATSLFVRQTNSAVSIRTLCCKYCKSRWHHSCAMYDGEVNPNDFVCQKCSQNDNSSVNTAGKLLAKDLPRNKLSDFLEERVKAFLQQNSSGHCDEVFIRNVFSMQQTREVLPKMKERFPHFPKQFECRRKTIFAFQVIDGEEVCFFAMDVEEYDNTCPEPNKGTINISFIDSVKFFSPKQLRTGLYTELILAYFEYCKNMGFSKVHVLSSPPTDGYDYLFHARPPTQTLPTADMLDNWYRELFGKAKSRNIIHGCKSFLEMNFTSPQEFPYILNAFWPKKLEACCVADNFQLALDECIAEDKDEVFHISFYSPDDEKEVKKRVIKDEDATLPWNFLGDLRLFLIKCEGDGWQFSTLALAKYSTMRIVRQLHASSKELNDAFTLLRKLIPSMPSDKMSKIHTLRIATDYITFLDEMQKNDCKLYGNSIFDEKSGYNLQSAFNMWRGNNGYTNMNGHPPLPPLQSGHIPPPPPPNSIPPHCLMPQPWYLNCPPKPEFHDLSSTPIPNLAVNPNQLTPIHWQ
ncbi:unnamed protein product [Caenorhabditis sp. 36 PRJEB53466]|nr:unnamed protein product [Caenorhabditis sp. 36 PRJEB53466]